MERYERNFALEGIGHEGQEKLSKARVLVIGAGGLGSPLLYYLAAVGIGNLGIIDHDIVEESNLQRQIIHNTSNVGESKVNSAATKIALLNPYCKVVQYNTYFTETNGPELVEAYDFVVDCCDTHAVKYLINDICVASNVPYCHGAVLGYRGEVMTILPGTANYRTVFNESPAEGTYDTAREVGVLGSAAGIVGAIQATEVIKYFTGVGELLVNTLLLIDTLKMEFHKLKVK